MDRIILHDQESWARENTPEALADAIEEFSGDDLKSLGAIGCESGGRALFLAASFRATALHLPRGLRKLPAALSR